MFLNYALLKTYDRGQDFRRGPTRGAGTSGRRIAHGNCGGWNSPGFFLFMYMFHVSYRSTSFIDFHFIPLLSASSPGTPADRYAEAERHDPHEQIFLDTARDVLDALAPVIDRWPKYAWVAKHLLEPERVSGFVGDTPSVFRSKLLCRDLTAPLLCACAIVRECESFGFYF